MQQGSQNPEKNHTAPAAGTPNDSTSRILGDFEIHREIGRGGMGTVYEASQVSLQRTVALKVLAPHIASTSKAVSRFRREAQAAAKLHHTHIVPIFAQGEADGSYFYAMEMVEGDSLHATIMKLRAEHRNDSACDQSVTVVLPQRSASNAATTKKINPAKLSGSSVRDSAARLSDSQAFGTDELFHDAARHLADVADALEYAHLNGVVHRDIKPHNLLFGRDGRLRISDFGLARLAEQPGVTMTGEVLGSPLYMSPEQITADPNAVDHRTDIYSLGATMYEWLTLSPPYPGETRERVISKILSTEPRPLRSENPAVPLDLETICLKAIERDPNRRYQSAGEMRDDLRRYLLSRPIVARREGAAMRGVRFLLRHQIAALLVTAIFAGSVLIAALWKKDHRVKLEQAEAVKAKAEVVEAKEAVVDVTTDKDILKAMLNTVIPGGGAIAERVAGREFPTASLPTETLTNFKLRIVTPSEIAVRAVKTFYSSVADEDWPDEKTISESQIALIDQARGRWAEGDAQSAQDLISQYIAQLPAATPDVEALQMRAALHAVLGQFEAMLADAEALLDAGTPTGYVWRGLARLLLNQAKPSLRDFDSAKLGDAGQQFMWVKVFQGLALLQSQQSALAKNIFQEVLRDLPTSLAAHLGLGVSAHLGHAIALHNEEDYAAALPEVEEVLKSDPKNIQALTLRGECRAMLGDLDGALRDFKEAMSIAGYLPELLARYLAVMNKRDTLREASAGSVEEQVPVEGEVKSRHGTDQGEPTAPPVFKWLRQRMPENESGAMQPQSNMFHWDRFRLPVP